MNLIIGTDEAGYGPNIGPLCITASAWKIPDRSVAASDLYEYLSAIFCRPSDSDGNRLPIGDSKRLYSSGSGLGELERTILPVILHGGNQQNVNWNDLQKLLHLNDPSNRSVPKNGGLPWYEGFNPELPLRDGKAAVEPVKPSGIIDGLDRLGVRTEQRTCQIEPEEFNHLCDRLGNKATLLSHATLSLAKSSLLKFLAENPNQISSVTVVCDKHGGRNKYVGVLQNVFEECWIQVDHESANESIYRFSFNDIPTEFRFVAKGDSLFLPIAFASMVSKYTREISMIAFNQFWQKRVSNLQSTAGYPVDAKRFRAEVNSEIQSLGIEEKKWWRLK